MSGPWDPDPRRAPARGRGVLWLVLMLGVAALVAFLAWRFPGAIDSNYEWSRIVYLLLLLVLLSGSVMAGSRLRLKGAAKAAALWLVIVAVLTLGYSYRQELGMVGERVLGEILPHRGTVVGDGEVQFPAGLDGHFRIEALVNGTPIRFLVDTGASRIVLSPADAKRLGIQHDRLAFTGFAETANGTVRTAAVRLGRIEIGPIRMTDLPASVIQSELRTSLLGMTFLERLRSFEVRGGVLILRE